MALVAKEHIGEMRLWRSDGFLRADFLYVPTVPYKFSFMKIKTFIIRSITLKQMIQNNLIFE